MRQFLKSNIKLRPRHLLYKDTCRKRRCGVKLSLQSSPLESKDLKQSKDYGHQLVFLLMEMVSLESKLEKLGIDDDDDDEKLVKHYKSSQKILLVGEGDFSFAACLAESFGSAANMVATSLDSAEMVRQKYLGAARNIYKLETMECRVVHGVNAHSMATHPLLHQQVFDRIIFNFPHTTLKRGEANILQIQSHQRLVKGFLESAGKMLAEKGEAHVTHKTCSPYHLWKIESLAEEVGLRLVEKARFKKIDYRGYQNKRGFSLTRADETFNVGACLTYKFANP